MKLFTPPQKRIIELLLLSDKTLSELATALGRSRPGTSKYLKQLESFHLVKGTYERTVDGRAIRYHLQPFHMILSIDPSSKTVFGFSADDALDGKFLFLGFIPQQELRKDVKRYLQELQKTVIPRLSVILYGSVAQGTATRKSDIDFLFVKEAWTKQEQESILRFLADGSEQTTHQAKPLFVSLSEYASMDSALQKEINDSGVILFENGSPWEILRKNLQRYKTITS